MQQLSTISGSFTLRIEPTVIFWLDTGDDDGTEGESAPEAGNDEPGTPGGTYL